MYTIILHWENGANQNISTDIHGSFENAAMEARDYYELRAWEGVTILDPSGSVVYSDR